MNARRLTATFAAALAIGGAALATTTAVASADATQGTTTSSFKAVPHTKASPAPTEQPNNLRVYNLGKPGNH